MVSLPQATRKIVEKRDELRKLVESDPKLARDLEFFVNRLGWDRERFLDCLYWDSGIVGMHKQTVLADTRLSFPPVYAFEVYALREDLLSVARKLEALGPGFPPARGFAIRDREGRSMQLWELLDSQGAILDQWLASTERMERLRVDAMKRSLERLFADSLYAKILAELGHWHPTHLLPLVNAARVVLGLEPKNERAFVVWLNRMKGRQPKPNLLSTSPNGPV